MKTVDLSDAAMLAMASSFMVIPGDPMHGPRTVQVVLRSYGDHPEAWAIAQDSSNLTKDGDWIFEPRPSARDEDYYALCRWPNAREAIAFVWEHFRKHPTGYKPEDGK